jgi:hypothetical protein
VAAAPTETRTGSRPTAHPTTRPSGI